MTPEQANQMIIEVQTIVDQLANLDYLTGLILGGMVALAFWVTCAQTGVGK